jgi:PST family polysaccharide transporter
MADPTIAPVETLTRKALVGTSWSVISTIARQVLSFVCSVVMAKLLGPEAYGLMGMVTLIASFLLTFRDLGTTTVIIQRQTVSNRLLSTLFWVNCGVGFALCLIVLCVSVPAAHFFNEPRLTKLLAVSSLSFIITSSGLVHNAVLTRNMAFGKLGITDLLSGVGGYVIAIPCALLGFGVWSLVFANLANSVISTALYWRLSGWMPSAEFDMEELRSVRKFSMNLSAFGLINYFSRNADNLIVGKVLGKVQLGYYQMAYNLMFYPIQNISSQITQVLLPAFSKIQNDDERYRSSYTRGCMLIGLFTFPVIAGMGILANPLIYALLGPKWAPAIILFQILAPVGFAQSVQTVAGQIFVAKARPDLLLKVGIGSAILFVTSFLIGVRYGAAGVASAYFIAYFVFNLYPVSALAFSLIGLSFSHFVRQLLPQIAITGVMGLGCILWLKALELENITNPWVRLISGATVGMFLYIGLMIRIRPAVVGHFEDIIAQSHSSALIRTLKSIGLFPEK